MAVDPSGHRLALILALSHTILSRGLENRDFLARCTVGSNRFRDSVMGVADGLPKTPAWAAPICDVPAHEIEALALSMTQAHTMLSMAWSLQRQDRGEAVIWAGLNLACLLGQIGQPGCGFGFGYGSMNTNGRPVRRWKWPSMPQGVNPVAEFIPSARITDMLESPGARYRYDGGTYTYPDARLVWWAGGNPFHHHQDLNRLARAWRNPETVIVNDFVWTATARRADIVLPCTSPLERDDLMLQSKDPVAIFMSRVLDPFCEARCDYDIFADLSSRMGVADAFTEGRSLEDWLRHLWAEARKSAAGRGVTLPNFDGFREVGWVDIPVSAYGETLFEAFVRDPAANPLRTPSGRIEMASGTIGAMKIATLSDTPEWREPVEWLGQAQADELHLISPQPQHRLHGQNDGAAELCPHKVLGREVCRLHPDTATHRSLSEGDVAEIHNARGACLAAVALDPEMRPDCVVLPTGAWLDVIEIDGRPVDVHGNPNVLTLDKGSSELSQGTSAHTSLVRVRKWELNLPPVTVFDGPHFER
jgi:biotin/methionine sulfoxide reductase